MIIKDYPGPKAEAFVAGQSQPYKFGSTRDLFVYRARRVALLAREDYVEATIVVRRYLAGLLQRKEPCCESGLSSSISDRGGTPWPS